MKDIKNLTYSNLIYVARIIERTKGYDFDESVKMARNIFEELSANPNGKSISGYIDMILTKDEYEKEYGV